MKLILISRLNVRKNNLSIVCLVFQVILVQIILFLFLYQQREIVHNELSSLELLSVVPTELATLYTVLEKEFHPLDMMQRVQPCLEWIEKQESLKQYLIPLRQLILLRVLKQMETVFSVMKLQNYEQLIHDLQFNRFDVYFVSSSLFNRLNVLLWKLVLIMKFIFVLIMLNNVFISNLILLRRMLLLHLLISQLRSKIMNNNEFL